MLASKDKIKLYLKIRQISHNLTKTSRKVPIKNQKLRESKLITQKLKTRPKIERTLEHMELVMKILKKSQNNLWKALYKIESKMFDYYIFSD